jgi:hypothetical protein
MWIELTLSNLAVRDDRPSKKWINSDHITSMEHIKESVFVENGAMNLIMSDSMQWRTEVKQEIEQLFNLVKDK